MVKLLNDRCIIVDIARRRLTLNEFSSNVDYLIIPVDAVSDHRQHAEELDSRHNISTISSPKLVLDIMIPHKLDVFI